MQSIRNINSIKDPVVVQARELTVSKNRREQKKCLLEGQIQIQWALDASIKIEHVFVHDKSVDSMDQMFLSQLRSRQIDIFSVSDGILKKITDTSYLVPLIGVANVAQVFHEKKARFTIVLDDLKDFGNIGTIIRTGMAFGIDTINFTCASADPFFKKTIDASRGAVFRTTFKCFESASRAVVKLKEAGFQIVATSPYGKTLQNLAVLDTRPVALFVGNETEGCSDAVMQQADLLVQIPMSANIESLNVAVAAGISIYELNLKMVITMITEYIKGTLGRNLGVTHQLIRQLLSQEIQKVCTLSIEQYIMLMVLACDRVMTFVQISKDFGLHGDELQNSLKLLSQAGYITVFDTEIKILPAGEELIAKLWPVRNKVDEMVLNGFSDNEKTQLHEMLKRMQVNCEEKLDK